MKRTTSLIAAFLGLSCFLWATRALATPLVFTIDHTQSALIFSVLNDAVPFTTPQFAGSDTAHLSGTINVDVSGGNVQFDTTGDIQFDLQPSPVAPGPGGAFPGSAPGQYGLLGLIPRLVSGPGPGGAGLWASRSMVGDTTSGIIPLVAGTFDSKAVTWNLTSGVADINALIQGSPLVGTVALDNQPSPDLVAGGTLTFSGGVYTLTLPISTRTNDVFITYAVSGTIVATSAPEPSGLALAGCGLLGLFAWAWRRRKKLGAS